MIQSFLEFGNSVCGEIAPYIKNSSFPNTMLIEGGSAESRLNLARLIAQTVLCTGEPEKPCGKCNSCVKSAAKSHPDLKEFGEVDSDAAFKVDTCRAIRSDCFIIPNDGDKKVYILKEVQNMNDSGENSLLKIFEEPPEYVYFIMTCQSRSSMLDTILSRATVFSIGSENESNSFDEKTFSLSADISKALLMPSENELLASIGALEKDKGRFKNVTLCMRELFRDALKIKSGGNPDAKNADVSALLSSKLTADRIYACYNTLGELYTGANINQNYNLLITSLCYKLREAVGK